MESEGENQAGPNTLSHHADYLSSLSLWEPVGAYFPTTECQYRAEVDLSIVVDLCSKYSMKTVNESRYHKRSFMKYK